MNDRHRRVARLKAQEEKRKYERTSRIIREMFSRLRPVLVGIAEGIAKVAKAMNK